MTKRRITEAEAEKYADARLFRLLRTDPAYIHAEDSESQAIREDELSEMVWRDIEDEYEVMS